MTYRPEKPQKSQTRKFIAGASCPVCSQVDKIYIEEGTQTLSCISCGHHETREKEEPEIIVRSSRQKD